MYSPSATKYGLPPLQPAGADYSAAGNAAVTTGDAHISGHGLENPFVWLFGIGALTLGLIGVSTHVRVGNVRAGIDAGAP